MEQKLKELQRIFPEAVLDAAHRYDAETMATFIVEQLEDINQTQREKCPRVCGADDAYLTALEYRMSALRLSAWTWYQGYLLTCLLDTEDRWERMEPAH